MSSKLSLSSFKRLNSLISERIERISWATTSCGLLEARKLDVFCTSPVSASNIA